MAEFMVTDEDREESIIERRDRERAENGKVDNEEQIPLIPNVKLDMRRTIHEIQVWKLDPPGDGFKGAVAPHTTIPGIAKLFGNGIYDFHAHSQDGKILRRNSGVKISWQPPEKPAPEKAISSSGEASMDLLRWQAEQHRRDTERVEAFGRMVVDTTRETSTQQLQHQARQQEASTVRDRDFFAGMIAQQQTFFQNMMMMTTQAHEHARERAREDFHQTIQLIHTTNERALKAQDPTLLLGLFERGLALGTGMNDDDAEDNTENAAEPWVQAIQAGASAIKDISDVAKIKAIAQPKRRTLRPPLETSEAQPTPASEPAQPPPATPSANPGKKRKLPFDRDQLRELVAIKQVMDAKGLDFTATLRNASEYFASGGEVDENESPSGASDSDADESENPVVDH